MKKRSLFLASVFMLLVALQACSAINRPESSLPEVGIKGQESPEMAAEMFVNALIEGDKEAALSFFASKKIAENTKMETVTENIPPLLQELASLPQGEKEAQQKKLLERLQTAEKDMLQSFMQSFAPQKEQAESAPSSEVKQADPIVAMKGLTIVFIDNPQKMQEAAMLEDLQKIAESYGADEIAERALLYSVKGETYLGGMQFLRFGKNWFIYSLRSQSLGTPGYAVFPMEKEVYETKVRPQLGDVASQSQPASSVSAASASASTSV